MKAYEKTLAEFIADENANPTMAPGNVRLFENEQDMMEQWIIEIEEAIDDEEDVPAENVKAFEDYQSMTKADRDRHLAATMEYAAELKKFGPASNRGVLYR